MQQVYRTYSTRDGLPQATIQALEADQRGWLWAATQNGVAYHNGHHWQALPALNRAMRTGFWQGRRILADRTSDLWFGTHGDGLYHLQARPATPPETWAWTHYTREDGLPSDTVLALHEDDNGLLWVGTAQGLGVFRDSSWTRVSLPDSLASVQFYAIHEDEDGFLFGTDTGLVAYNNGAWSKRPLPGMLRHRDGYALYEDRTGTLWAGLRGGIAKRVGGSWYAVREESIDPQRRQNENYIAIAEQADGTLGFAQRSGGLLRLHRDGTWDVLDERNGLPSHLITSLYQHPDGSYWVGTASGLAVLRNDTWHAVNETIDMATASLWAITEMRDGAMWFGASRSLSIYKDGRWQTLLGPDGPPLPYTLAIHEAQDGRVWIGTRRGLFAYDNGAWPVIDRDHYVYDFIERTDGSLLFGTQDGVWQYAGGKVTRFAPDQPLLRGTVRTLEQLDDGTLWFGVSETGLVRYNGTSWKHLSTDDGLPNNTVLDVFKDSYGLLWITTTKGLVLYNGTAFRVFTDVTPVRLPDPFTYRIEQDGSGRYYVSTNLGIARLTLDPSQHASARNLPLADLRFKVEHFGLADGLPELEANQGASLRDSQGRIWFGLISGVAMMDPRATSFANEALPLTIHQVDIADLSDSTFSERLRAADGPLALSHTQHDLTFSFTLGAPGNPDQVHYQTQLLGYDPEPSSWTDTPTRTYTNLPPGSYTFAVVGRTGTGPPSAEAQFAFRIARPPWATWWAYALYTLLAGLAVAGLVHWQTERIRRRDAQQAAIEQERLSREVAEAQTRLLHSENLRLAEMNQANEFQQRVMDGTTEAIFALDLDGRFTLFNPRLEALTGLTKAQLRKQAFTPLFTPDSADQVQDALDTVLRDKAPVRALEVQLSLLEQPYLSLTLSPLMQDEEVTGIIGLAKDITEQRHLEQFQEDMMRMFVHDLRNPLSIVLMISRELKDNPDMDPEVLAEMATMAFRNSEQALSLVNKLLDVNRLEAQKMPLECTSLGLKEIIHRVADSMRPLFDEREITFHTELSHHLPPAYADASLLHRVLQNLLNNATRHTPQHGTITLSLRPSGGHLTLRISDTGPGIDPDLRPHLFEKYASGNNGTGVGLGLAFCRLAIEAMDGTIWLDETVSEGASFVLTLPMAPTHTPARQPQQVS